MTRSWHMPLDCCGASALSFWQGGGCRADLVPALPGPMEDRMEDQMPVETLELTVMGKMVHFLVGECLKTDVGRSGTCSS